LLRHNLWQALRRRDTLGDFDMPPHQGVGSFPMHLFSRREITRLVRNVGFRIVEVQPVSVVGPLARPWCGGGLRAYGFLIAARTP
jgi:hypothetical protein